MVGLADTHGSIVGLTPTDEHVCAVGWARQGHTAIVCSEWEGRQWSLDRSRLPSPSSPTRLSLLGLVFLFHFHRRVSFLFPIVEGVHVKVFSKVEVRLGRTGHLSVQGHTPSSESRCSPWRGDLFSAHFASAADIAVCHHRQSVCPSLHFYSLHIISFTSSINLKQL